MYIHIHIYIYMAAHANDLYVQVCVCVCTFCALAARYRQKSARYTGSNRDLFHSCNRANTVTTELTQLQQS